jgi:hypothetical protein
LVSYAGAIDWNAAMMETQKIGYKGTLMFEGILAPGYPATASANCRVSITEDIIKETARTLARATVHD